MMPKSTPFLITGLPRCRTAWLSVAASLVPGARCWHEPLKWLDRWEDVIPEIWERGEAQFVGVSDHALGFHLGEILEELRLRVLVVERPVAEVEASLRGLGLPSGNYCRLLYDALTVVSPLVRRINYVDLSRSHMVAKALEWLMPGAEVDRAALSMLQDFNIQVKVEEVRRLLAARPGCAYSMLGADVMAKLRMSADA